MKYSRILFLSSFFWISFVLTILLGVSGCSTILDSTNSASAKLTVQYTTIKVISRSDNPTDRRDRIIKIASSAREYFDNDKLPIIEIERLIRAKIKWEDLDAADTLLIDALITRVKAEVENSQTIDNEYRVSGSKVLGWIIEGAQLTGG